MTTDTYTFLFVRANDRSKKGIPEAVDFIFCVGDDRTDEDMFQVLKLFRQVRHTKSPVGLGLLTPHCTF